MANNRPPGRSLYANLLDNASTISSEPVIFAQKDKDEAAAKIEAAKKQISAAALRFQPTAKQQQQKPKHHHAKPKPTQGFLSTSSPDKEAKSSGSPGSAHANPPVQKSTLADWTAPNEDDDYYGAGPRGRGGRKRRKKNAKEEVVPQDWDDIYDPTRPNRFHDYKHSDEYYNEKREWKDRLYARHDARQRVNSDSHGPTRISSSTSERAPVISRNFAPPTSFDEPTEAVDSSPEYTPDVPDDPTGEDAYMRRMRLSELQPQKPSEFTNDAQFPAFAQSTQPPAFVPSTDATTFGPSMQPPAFLQSMQAPMFVSSSDTALPSSDVVSSISVAYTPLDAPAFAPASVAPAPPAFQSSAVISAAPVRYNLPAPPPDLPANEAELQAALQKDADETMEDEAPEREQEPAPRSNRPGQKGFAERLMKKYGWNKGQGLGAEGSGITTALAVQVNKRKKLPDALGGGFAGPSGMGKIVGGKKKKGTDDGPAMSPVVVCRHMLDGMDVATEMREGNLQQEIGQECDKNYGKLERVFIFDQTESDSVPVFLQFTEAISALRAVSALHGRAFGGNIVQAEFYDEEKFGKGIYE